MYPPALQQLIDRLAQFPTIGKKSAERLALWLLTTPPQSNLEELGVLLQTIRQTVYPCPTCNCLIENGHCAFCGNDQRDQNLILVTGNLKDVYQIENLETFSGVYLVTKGLIDYSRGISELDLELEKLYEKVNSATKEVILAFDTTLNGELTANYVKQTLLHLWPDLVITRFSYGLPYGMDLKYVDNKTLQMALSKRIKY